jgi:hypothetical protein
MVKYSMTHPNSVLCCYRLTSVMPYDEELVWADVQQYGGALSIKGDCIDFWIPPRYQSFIILRWPLLVRRADWDYVDHRVDQYQS